MHLFHQQHKLIQWIIALIMLMIFLIVIKVCFDVIIHYPFAILLIMFFAPIQQLLLTPIFYLTKVFTYQSPMLLVFNASKEVYDLHNGTSFDYLMVITKKPKNLSVRRQLLLYYLEGLLSIINQVEKEELPMTLQIRGSSYFFSERTAIRLGFEVSAISQAEYFNLILNYLDLLWMYSLVNGKLSFPNLKNSKTVSITAANLIKQKEKLLAYYNYLKR